MEKNKSVYFILKLFSTFKKKKVLRNVWGLFDILNTQPDQQSFNLGDLSAESEYDWVY